MVAVNGVVAGKEAALGADTVAATLEVVTNKITVVAQCVGVTNSTVAVQPRIKVVIMGERVRNTLFFSYLILLFEFFTPCSSTLSSEPLFCNLVLQVVEVTPLQPVETWVAAADITVDFKLEKKHILKIPPSLSCISSTQLCFLV